MQQWGQVKKNSTEGDLLYSHHKLVQIFSGSFVLVFHALRLPSIQLGSSQTKYFQSTPGCFKNLGAPAFLTTSAQDSIAPCTSNWHFWRKHASRRRSFRSQFKKIQLQKWSQRVKSKFSLHLLCWKWFDMVKVE